MPDHTLAFADIMAELLAQSPDKPSDPPPVKSESVLEDKTDLVLQSLIGVSETAKPAVAEQVETVVPEVVVQEAASTPDSEFYAAVARFKSMMGGS